jgi:hypothetical protein
MRRTARSIAEASRKLVFPGVSTANVESSASDPDSIETCAG